MQFGNGICDMVPGHYGPADHVRSVPENLPSRLFFIPRPQFFASDPPPKRALRDPVQNHRPGEIYPEKQISILCQKCARLRVLPLRDPGWLSKKGFQICLKRGAFGPCRSVVKRIHFDVRNAQFFRHILRQCGFTGPNGASDYNPHHWTIVLRWVCFRWVRRHSLWVTVWADSLKRDSGRRPVPRPRDRIVSTPK